MSFSFIDIEEKKSRIIAWVFLSVILFYFLTAYILLAAIENSYVFYFREAKEHSFFLPPLHHALGALTVAFLAALFHWLISTGNLIEKMSAAVGAMPVDPKDTYHQYFKNIVDEACVAMGRGPIEAMVIPLSGLNSFSLQDFNKTAVIGVTEGLLARLNRSQIEAVVAHEAGHIASGDSLTATVICSLSEIYEESISGIKAGLRGTGTRGRGAPVLLLILLVLSAMHFLSSLLRYFISRQREYRADAVAVRLTRNPLSLAEALKLISGHWRGSGAQGEKMESIFIVNPRFNSLDEKEGLISDAFSTHPPVSKRINILLRMAHLDERTLEENLSRFKRISPVAAAEFKPLDSGAPACCPLCKAALQELNYEGAPVLKCPYCRGVFVGPDKISRILIRNDKIFSEEAARLAEVILSSKDRYKLKKSDAKSAWAINCPKCQRKMHRHFFVYSYPVEIDRCAHCSGIWFDKSELEILQYLYEHKELLYNIESN